MIIMMMCVDLNFIQKRLLQEKELFLSVEVVLPLKVVPNQEIHFFQTPNRSITKGKIRHLSKTIMSLYHPHLTSNHLKIGITPI